MATSIAQVDGTTHIYLANFAGLVGGANPVQTPQKGVRVITASKLAGKGFFLPFLGETEAVEGTRGGDGRTTYSLPLITRGGVFWYKQ